MKRIIDTLLFASLIAGSAYGQGSQSAGSFRDFIFTLRPASGALTTDEIVGPLTNTSMFEKAEITLDVTTLTLADADDKVCFYAQTTYGGGFWTDVESICFTDADDGTTARRVIVIDGAKDGPGTNLSITGTDPAAGAEISETVPANTIWRVKSMWFRFVSDASGTPRVQLLLDDGVSADPFWKQPAAEVQNASSSWQYSIGEGVESIEQINGIFQMSLPPNIFLSAGYRLSTVTVSIDAGDNYGAPQLSVEAWHDPLSSTRIGDNLKSYDRPIGSEIRLRTIVTGATAPTYAYSATILLRASQ